MPKRKEKFYLDKPIVNQVSYNERDVLDKIINYPSHKWETLPEYEVLRDHFACGGSLHDVDTFYNNITAVSNYQGGRGCDLIYLYVRNVLKKRLPIDVEGSLYKILWKNYRTAKVGYKYAKYVVRGKLPVEFEVGCNNFDYVNFLYINKLEYESVLMNESRLAYQFYRNNYFLPDMVHHSMMAKHMIGDHAARIYFKQRRKDDKIIKNRLSVIDGSKTVSEVINNLS